MTKKKKKIKEDNRFKAWMGALFLWGILTGRCLPQWEDMANSPIWFGEIIMYWIMFIIGLIIILNEHRTRRQ